MAGHSAAVEDDRIWAVRYMIELDETWTTRSAHVWGQSGRRQCEVRLEHVGRRWHVDGSVVPALDGCVDVDLEASACTNTIPVHRLALQVGESASVPAAYVRALDLAVERLDQEYARVGHVGGPPTYDYRAPGFDFESRLVYDDAGLDLDYPGIATRVA
jgi:hypothetical protein